MKRGIVRKAALFATMAAFGVVVVACATSSGSAAASGSGSSGDLPEWYLDPQSVYPDEIYLVAIGTGDTRRDAEQQALAGLSQIFEARINVDARTSERYRELMSAQGNVTESEIRLAQDIDVRSNQTLLNVQFGEAAVDEAARVHVIAYLERLPTARVYVDLIETNGRQVESFLTQADTSDELVREYAYVSAAAVVSASNAVLQDQLRIISPGFSEIAQLPYDPDAVLRRRADVASQMRVSVDVAGDQNGRIASLVREALSEERLPVGADNPVLVVTGRVGIEPAQTSADFESVRWTLTLGMADRAGRTLVTYDDQSRASGISQEAATAFAYRDMEEAVEREFVAAMRAYFDGLVLGD